MEDRNQPNHEIRLGTIRATIWANHRQGEPTWYRVTTSRLYREGDTWRNTQSFRPDDLPTLGKVLDMAHNWLLSQATTSKQPAKAAQNHTRNDARVSVKKTKPKGIKKHGQNREDNRERVLMRQSKGGQVGLSRGSKHSGTAASSRRKDS